ncbi:MAG: tetratricopeptide repeat protein [Candidatus Curtissbacteria bacterium]|nr:tetratricopeptide repeat protein [Candidatus Curtissbacteria bacterium]
MQSVDSSGSQESASSQILAQAAITAALSSNWQEAIKLNKKILAGTENDVEALNRLARAYCCLGEYQKAEKMYKKVLEIDPYNIIAVKNLEKVTKRAKLSNGHSATNGNSITATATIINLSRIFLDEPGKTKIVNLINLAPPSTLAVLSCGDQVTMHPKNHSVTISTLGDIYLGAFPDDLAHRLLLFIGGGNQYEAYIKSASPKSLTIFVRETLRSEKFGNQPTFQAKRSMFEDELRPR